MKNNIKTKKEFDAVDMMRSIREKISKEIQGMTFEQEKEYLKNTGLAEVIAGSILAFNIFIHQEL